jgi:hypothetical protein
MHKEAERGEMVRAERRGVWRDGVCGETARAERRREDGARRQCVRAARCIRARVCGGNEPIRKCDERGEDARQRPGPRDTLSAGGRTQGARRASSETIDAALAEAGDRLASRAGVAWTI